VKKALVDQLRSLPKAKRDAILAKCSTEQIAALRWCWREFWARPDDRVPWAIEGTGQVAPPGDWTWFAMLGGRSSGKTRGCAEWTHEEALRLGDGTRFHLVGQTMDDAIATMINGQSGLIATAPPWAGFEFKASDATFSWRNGASGRLFSAEKARKGRGPQCNRMWLDDPAAYGPNGMKTLEQLLFGFRLRAPDGSPERGVISSTPLDSDIMRWIIAGSSGGRKSRVVFSRSITDDNRANLTETYFTSTLAEFAGTELEQQERYGIWDPEATKKVFAGIAFDAPPVRVAHIPPRFLAVAVWIDPSQSTTTRSCECGIFVAGLTNDGQVYLLEDLSGVLTSNEWPNIALDAVDRWAPVTAQIHLGVETNRGGNGPAELLRSADKIRLLQAGRPPFSTIEIVQMHTDKAKAHRAGPLPQLYKAGQIHHVGGFPALELQMRKLDDNPSTAIKRDRCDAAVYAILDLAGILDLARPGYGYGATVQAGTFGGSARQTLNVPPPAQRAEMMPNASFTFGGGSR